MKKVEKKEDSSKFAVIETGGKQYIVSSGTKLKIEIIPGVVNGASVSFDKVLLTSENDAVEIGTPYLSGRSVSGVVTEVGRAPKIEIVHYRQKSRHLKTAGHRQPFLAVTIENIK